MNEKEKEHILEDAKEDLRRITRSFVLPFIDGKGSIRITKVSDEITLTKRVKYNEESKTIYVFPTIKNPIMKISIFNARIQKQYVNALETILQSIFLVSKYTYEKGKFYQRYLYDIKIDAQDIYREKRYQVAYELGICTWLGGIDVYRIIDELTTWSTKTYEGSKIPFGILYNLNNGYKSKSDIDFVDFLKSDKNGALFSDGINSGIKLNYNGKIEQYISVSQHEGEEPLTPLMYSDFAALCTKDENSHENIGIVLMKKGTILVVKNKRLILAKKDNSWHFINSTYMIDILYSIFLNEFPSKNYLCNEYATKLYRSVLDVAFMGHGGCLAIINEENIDVVKERYCNNDLLEYETENPKHNFIKKIINYNNSSIFDIDRNLILDLLSMDGAVIITTKGEILAAGAIVKVEGGSNEGGRTAATKQLARFGMAIKISEDGTFSFYKANKSTEAESVLVHQSL